MSKSRVTLLHTSNINSVIKWKQFLKMLLLVQIIAAAIGIFVPDTYAAEDTEILFEDDFNSPAALKKWSKCSILHYQPNKGIDGSGCMVFSNNGTNGGLSSVHLDMKKARGHRIFVEGMLKAENLTKPSQSYLGPKLMIHIKSPSRSLFIDQTKEYGTYGWKKFSVFARVPNNVEKLDLCIGVQSSSGKLYIDNVKVFILPKPAVSLKIAAKSNFTLPQKTKWRGVMSGSQMQDKDIRELAEKWNVNLIRYQIVNNRPRQDISSGKKFMDWINNRLPEIDRVLKLCGKYNIKVLLDLHSGPNTKQGKLLSNELSWTFESQDALVKAWEKLSEKYKNNPAVWGYDILNEPREDDYVYTPDGPLDWNRLAERIAKAIRKIDPKTPIIVEPAQWGSPAGLSTFSPIDTDNIIYSVHFYSPHQFTHQGIHGRDSGFTYPGVIAKENWNKYTIIKHLQPVIDFQKKYKVPILIGEFSAVRWAPGAARYLQDLVDIFEENGWDWTYHAFREYNGWDLECSSDKNIKGRQKTTDRKQLMLKYYKLNKRENMEEENFDIGSDALSHIETVSSLRDFKPAANEFRIYYIGDSITRHGFNKSTIEKLKWDHLAGMAASSEEKDFAHLLASAIGKRLDGKKVQLFFGKGHDSAGAITGLKELKAYRTQLVVVQLGEHAKPKNSFDKTRKDYTTLLNMLTNLKSKPMILCTGVWNPQKRTSSYVGWTADVEQIQREVCNKFNIPFVSVEKYALNPTCSGTGGSGGVRWHPNDKGMEGYARELFRTFKLHYAGFK